MIENRADKLVLKAFLELDFPEALKREDAAFQKRCGESLRGLANRLLMSRNSSVEILELPILSKEDKALINLCISRCTDEEQKLALVFYSRLMVLVESLLLKYRIRHI